MQEDFDIILFPRASALFQSRAESSRSGEREGHKLEPEWEETVREEDRSQKSRKEHRGATFGDRKERDRRKARRRSSPST
jgi:hypothetical protein